MQVSVYTTCTRDTVTRNSIKITQAFRWVQFERCVSSFCNGGVSLKRWPRYFQCNTFFSRNKSYIIRFYHNSSYTSKTRIFWRLMIQLLLILPFFSPPYQESVLLCLVSITINLHFSTIRYLMLVMFTVLLKSEWTSSPVERCEFVIRARIKFESGNPFPNFRANCLKVTSI